jgi:hypothetical protein
MIFGHRPSAGGMEDEGKPCRAGLTSPRSFGGFDMSKREQNLGRAAEGCERFTALG